MATKEPEILSDGIRIDLGGSFWIKFTKVWGSTDAQKFRNTQNDILALRMLIEKVVDWHIPDANWNDLPFEKEKLLKQIDEFVADLSKECFSIPTALQVTLARSFYDAIGASYRVPFAELCPSG